jgi:hypothetical protein
MSMRLTSHEAVHFKLDPRRAGWIKRFCLTLASNSLFTRCCTKGMASDLDLTNIVNPT